MSVCRDLGTFVKRNKTQLRDYMTTGPARVAEIPVSRCRDPGIAVPASRLTGLKFFHVIAFAGLARPIKPARVQRVISIPYTS